MSKVESIRPYLEPVRKSVVVRRSPQEAFEIFTTRIGAWWPFTSHSIHGAETATCTIEPSVGGQVYETARSGERAPWGTILAWEPPLRFVMSWHPGSDPETATEVELRFVGVAEGTRVELEHRNWTRRPDAEEARGGYDSGWDHVFGRCFAEACA